MAVRVLFKVGTGGPGYVDIGGKRYSLPAGSTKALSFPDPVNETTVNQYSSKSTNLSYEVVGPAEPDPEPNTQVTVTNLSTMTVEGTMQ